jgi:hypothetical protein
VVDAVHAKGAEIFLQLWHCGRASHRYFFADERFENGWPLAPEADMATWHTPQEGATSTGRPIQGRRRRIDAEAQKHLGDYMLLSWFDRDRDVESSRHALLNLLRQSTNARLRLSAEASPFPKRPFPRSGRMVWLLRIEQ